MTAIGVPGHADVLWDNNGILDVGGYSNAPSGVFGARHAALDDFVVPSGDGIVGFSAVLILLAGWGGCP